MDGFKISTFVFILLGLQFYCVQCCERKIDLSGGVGVWTRYGSQRCWAIQVPWGYFIHLQMSKMESESTCDEDYVRVNITGSTDEFKFCSSDRNKNPIIAFGNVTVDHDYKRNDGKLTSFTLRYTIKSMECLSRNNFKCDDNICLLEEKVCNGVNDCENGKDEIGCETGLQTIKEISEVKKNAVSWLKQKRTLFSGWMENTPRAVVALYLASAASFNGSVLEEELMAKQTEFSIAVSLLKSKSLTNSELSMFINGLLVTCHDPRQFYNHNLVKRLKDQVEETGNFTHPLAYMALCNANETWPLKATTDLINILKSDFEYPFIKDLQAIAIMALSCNYSRNIDNMLSNGILELYNETIQHFKKIQAHDGSFGNVYTTAFITQALLSSGQEHSRDWNLNATITYLMKKLNSSTVDFLATYLILPILNGKSLMDISYVNCSANPRKHGDDPYTEISDYLVPKLRVQYSLYVGNETAVHSISLKVPENSTAFDVMQLAESKDRKYKFEWKKTVGEIYVYEIASIKNDPEAGKFWLLYKEVANSSRALTHLTKGPDKIIMSDREHLVLWYETI